MNWFKQQIAHVAGTQEPEYGAAAIQTVTEQAKTTPYTVAVKDDLRWRQMQHTCVESRVFYFMTDEGDQTMCQIIYSNVHGIRTTCQFNTKIYDHDGPFKHQWHSDGLEQWKTDDSQTACYAKDLECVVSDDGDSISIKSGVNKDCIVDLKLSKAAPAFKVGKDGTSYFGTDHSNPWGSMSHVFWPRCTATGTMTTPKKTYNMQGRACAIHALMNMQPHHIAAKWNFVNFQTPTYSAVMMEYTTPPSYNRTVVNVGGIVKDGEILYAGANNSCKHLAATHDPEGGWPEPKAVLCKWDGQSSSGQAVSAEIMGDLPQKAECVDVLAHIPGIIKALIGSTVGIAPRIYQYASTNTLKLKVKVGEKEAEEQGKLFAEATFIS